MPRTCVFIKYQRVDVEVQDYGNAAAKVAEAAAALRQGAQAQAQVPGGGTWEDLSVVGWYGVHNGVREDVRLVNGVYTNTATGQTYEDCADARAAVGGDGAKPFFSAGVCYMVGERDSGGGGSNPNPTLTAPPPGPQKADSPESDSDDGVPMVTMFENDDDW